jgi:hypothetical protein
MIFLNELYQVFFSLDVCYPYCVINISIAYLASVFHYYFLWQSALQQQSSCGQFFMPVLKQIALPSVF